MKNSKTVFEGLKLIMVANRSFFYLIALAICIPTATIAQTTGDNKAFGLKAGLNYNGNGSYVESITANRENPERNVGFHIGVFGKLGDQLYFRPELVFTSTKSNYDDDDFTMSKLDAPLLLGYKVFGPVSLFIGPSFQYILSTKFNDIKIDDVKSDFSVGLNFGVGLNLKNLGIDLRYERGFSDNEATFLGNNGINTSRLDTRPDQLILSLSIAL